MSKKYFWLKLKDDFFDEKYVKALRKLPGGETLVIVYLKMQLKGLKTEGIIKYDHIMPSAEEELALALDEDVNNVKMTISALLNMGIVEKWEDETIYLVAMQQLIGSETASAERVRKHRELQNNTLALQCNNDVTKCNTEIEIDIEKEKDIDNNKKNICPLVIEYLNSKAKTKYRDNIESTKRLVKARLNQGFTLEDFKKVIDIKCKQWLNNDMKKYLRPETLFGNKFESYLNESPPISEELAETDTSDLEARYDKY